MYFIKILFIGALLILWSCEKKVSDKASGSNKVDSRFSFESLSGNQEGTQDKQEQKTIADFVPQYKTIVNAAEKLKAKYGFILASYGINLDGRKKYSEIDGTDDFSVSFRSIHSRNDLVSEEKARHLLITSAELLLQEINSDEKIREMLTHYPITANDLKIYIHFKDECGVYLGQGVSSVWLYRGKIKYEGYNLIEHEGKFPSNGTYYNIHEESFEEAVCLVSESH